MGLIVSKVLTVLVHGPLLLFWAWNGGCFTNGNGNDDYKAHTTDAALPLEQHFTVEQGVGSTDSVSLHAPITPPNTEKSK
jgi:hypothetical protein